MDTYVYKNKESYKKIIEKLTKIMPFEILEGKEACLLLNDTVDIHIDKKYTSIRLKDMAYNVNKLKEAVTTKEKKKKK
jgi:hypothetical protein